MAELRQNPTSALERVAEGESLVVTKHRRPVAKLVPPDDDALLRIAPAKVSGSSDLVSHIAGDYSHDKTEALLREMSSEW